MLLLFKKTTYFRYKTWLFFRKALRSIPVIVYTSYLRFIHPHLYEIYNSIPGALSFIDAYYIGEDYIQASNRARIALEFGAYKGRATVILSYVAKKKKSKIFTFEWFQGLPKVAKDDLIFKKGEYQASKSEFIDNLKKAGCPDVVKVIDGDIRRTINKIPPSFDYAFVDVDLYEITKIILQKLLSIASGGEIIDVHDNHSPGVCRAIKEATMSCPREVSVRILPLTLITQIRVL